MIRVTDLGFYFLISIIGVYFYTRVLPLKYTKRITGFLIGGLIFASHLVLLIPTSNETVFNVIQMVGEFLAIYFLTKGKAAAKLIAYVEMNIAIGIGTIGADFIVEFDILNRSAAYTESSYIQRIVIYLAVSAVAYMVLAGIVILREKARKFIHIQGMEILVSMMLEILCLLYVIGMIMLETGEVRNISVIAAFPVLVLLIFIFLKISDYIREREKLYIKYYVMENVVSSTEYIIGRLREDEEYYRLQMDIMNMEIGEAYEAARRESIYNNMFLNVLLENKKEKAKKAGADMDISASADNESTVEARDCVTVAANLLDNAIEAVSQNHEDNRSVTVRIDISKNRFFLQVKNPYEKEPVVSDGRFETTKESKEGHGLGLRSVRRIVEKYGMEMEIAMEGGMFCVTIERKT